MTWAGGAGAGRVARWLLLACTLFGLAAMHTLGHTGMHESASGSTTVHGMADRLVPPAMVTGATSGDGCAGDGCTRLMPGSPVGGGMAGWSVCVAVLTGFAVLVLLTVLLWMVVTRPQVPGSWRSGGAGAARAPPARHRGLLLVTVSVLRI